MTRRRLAGESQKAGRWITGFSQIEFSPHMYIRSSPRGPNRDPNRTLSNELLLLLNFIKILNKNIKESYNLNNHLVLLSCERDARLCMGKICIQNKFALSP